MYFPLFCRSTYSICQGIPKTDEYQARIKSAGLAGCALADVGNLGGVPTFVTGMKKAGLKPLVGCEFVIVDDPLDKSSTSFSTIKALAKNQDGWRSLIKAVSYSNDPIRHHEVPRLSLKELAGFAKDWYLFSGVCGSTLADCLFTDARAAFLAATFEGAKSKLCGDWSERLLKCIGRHQELFGKNLWLDLQMSDPEILPAQKVLTEAMRWASKRTGVPCVASIDCRYFDEADAVDLRLLQCVDRNVPMHSILKDLEKGQDFRPFWMFRSAKFHLPTEQELSVFSSGELQATLDIAQECEVPDVGGKIYAPNFICPDGKSTDEYFREVCRDGWRQKIDPLLKALPVAVRGQKKKQYGDRISMELDVLTRAGFTSYFLMVRDYTIYARNVLKKKVGPGRGSVGGSLASYLADITRVDPVATDLLFERFLNPGRLQTGNMTYPDIDIDFEPDACELIIKYLRERYGHDCVSQMGTFLKLKGRSALRDVLRLHSRCSNAELNAITDPIPDEAAITDELQQMRDRNEDVSIILWSLQNHPDALREWCYLDQDGNLQGDLAFDFAQAIRLENCCRGMGKHASGVVVTPIPISDIVPMAYDRAENAVVTGYDMRDSEAAGLLKVDILRLITLSKLSMFERLMRTGSL